MYDVVSSTISVNVKLKYVLHYRNCWRI